MEEIQYFVKEFEGDETDEIKEIHCFYSLKELWKFMKNHKGSDISVYEAQCVLDWS